ncbi:MAG: hypothetical protein H5T64_12535 [Chloroflexi bacterium]|nr:hypothetical protein [Chloroflexota bacterium]
MSNWKQVERTLAKRLKGQRVGNRGVATPDVVSDWLSVEVKAWRSFPKWLTGALEQARHGCTDGTKLPIVILHEKGRHHVDDIVALRLKDFVDWFGEIARSSDTCESEFEA